MRQIHMMALLAAAVLASMVFLFSTPKKYGMILSDVFQKEGRERIVKMNCTSLLDSINPPFPAVLIDLPTLEALKQNQCSTNEHSVRVAVDAQHLNKIRKADFPNYDILYYEKPSCKDYLRFFDKETRIIPRIDFAVYRNFSIPANFKHFTEFWKRSELVDCIGMKVARPPIKSYLPTEKTLRTMSSLMMHLISFDIYPFLNGGSLLGWFRECAIIPHTYDADFAAHIEEYKPELLSDLQSNGTKFFLKRKFGRPNDTYEFTIRPLDGGRPSIDLFWMYTAENETWVGGTAGDGSKYKYTYPKTKTCAGDLLGHIFWVSCDPELVLKAEYGPEWYNDFPTNRFSWKSSQFNVKPNGKWTAEEMKEVYKVY